MNFIKKKIQSLLGNIFFKIFGKRKDTNPIYSETQIKILIIHLGNIQEVLSITPLIDVLSREINCSISLLIDKKSSVVFQSNNSINSIIFFQERPFAIAKTFMKMINEKYDVCIDAHELFGKNVSMLMGLIRAKHKVGFFKGDETLFTHSMDKKDPNKVHIVDRLLSLADAFEISFTKTDLNITYNPSEKSKNIIEDYIIKHDLNHKLSILLNISGNSQIGFWGTDNYEKLIKYLSNYDINLIIAASIDDMETAELLGKDKYLIFYNNEFDIFSELIKNMDFIFSPDSYVVQLASSFKIPIFCLFVQHKTNDMINIPYNSDFDFTLTEKNSLDSISYGKVLNSFIPYFDYIYERYKK